MDTVDAMTMKMDSYQDSSSSLSPFTYEESLLERCVLSLPLPDGEPHGDQADWQSQEHPCLVLFNQHAKHYHNRREEKMHSRLPTFLENARLVYETNRAQGSYRLALNQFSDRFPHELPSSAIPLDTTPQGNGNTFPARWLNDTEAVHQLARETIHNPPQRRLQQPQTVTLDELHVDAPNQNVYATVSTSSSSSSSAAHKDEIGETPAADSTVWDAFPPAFATHLNWATTMNPDGVSIVSPPPQQGTCGACWAFVATGTLEANIARRQAYLSAVNSSSSTTPWKQRQIERLAMIPLSVQQLLDCDTAHNRGCMGGNPVFAFPFIHEHGLTTARKYPYLGFQGAFCRTEPTVAKVETWGLVPPRAPEMMELVLQHIGPIAVGLNVADPTFLQYRTGIYDSLSCQQQSANHAVIIVGYGQEQIPITTASGTPSTETVSAQGNSCLYRLPVVSQT